MMRDFVQDIGIHSGGLVFARAEKNQIVAVRTISFTFVGEFIGVDDSEVTLKDAVMILWDGRHGEFASGKPPATAEIEVTYPVISINLDAVELWGPYPGNKIPRPQ